MIPASPLAKKLGVKPGAGVTLLNAPPGAEQRLQPLPDNVTVADDGPADVVIVFVPDAAAVEAWVSKAAALVVDRGLLWVVYPKGGKKAGTDLNRDILHAGLGGRGLVGVAMVAYDDTWSAMRFRPRAEVGS